ncbi:MAG: potassium-transporting ATPase subunit KdpC [Nitrospirae bacterium]|nr:potassium-transporting ATPase subunit KdpC [Nitrospirota bacterium]NTW66700.1 potassium-transporting ATPase subunit KdpC [Nitrospirota bacterium]
MFTMIRNALMSLLFFTVLTGLLYPLAVTGIAQVFFQHLANGSMIMKNGKAVGSALIGQQFDDPRYFWGRPSATTPYPYNGSSSSGSNLGPNNPDLLKSVRSRINALRSADPGNTAKIPVDLVTASGSGLDPHVSPAAAEYQVSRVAKSRRLNEARIREAVKQNTGERLFGVIGEPVVNVLQLNLTLDKLK